MRKIWAVLFTVGIMAHGYDLTRGPHVHDRSWDLMMHVAWIAILGADLFRMRKATP